MYINIENVLSEPD